MAMNSFGMTVPFQITKSPAPEIAVPARKSCPVTKRAMSGKKTQVETLWQNLFSNPLEWRDHRLNKVNPRYPDFKHQKTGEALWLDSKFIPQWVKPKLAALAPGTIEASNFIWNQRLSRYAKTGQYKEVIKLYKQMQLEGIYSDRFTFISVLHACGILGFLEEGRCIHAQITQNDFDSDVFVGSSLIDMYSKCGSMADAESVFLHMPNRDVVTWTAIITGYVKCGQGEQALELYQQMIGNGVEPNPVTFMAVLNACASTAALKQGRDAHEEILRRGYEADISVTNGLVNMYAKCGSIEDAERLFNQMPIRDVVTWTAMIMGYVKCGEGQKALELFQQMRLEGVDPNPVTFVAVLNACASVAALEQGRHAHEEIIKRGYEADVSVSNSLLDMYAKCGSIVDAETVFNQLPKRDLVAWNAMILGYVRCGEGQKGLELYREMTQQEIDTDVYTFVAILSACASVGALEEGRRAHGEIIHRGYEADVFVSSCLVDMYSRCGSIEDAERVFNKVCARRDVVVWNAMLAGYSRHGYAKEALEHFKRMRGVVQVDSFTFVSLLSACSHGGLVDEGLALFKSMSAIYNIPPSMNHYACIVDLLGRAGHLRQAEDVIRNMPIEASLAVWMTLLGACIAHSNVESNVEIAERSAKRILELDPDNAAGHVLLSNIYATGSNGDSSAKSHHQRVHTNVKKYPECTWIEVNNEVHSFALDCSEYHPQIVEMRAQLERLSKQMKDTGNVLDTRFEFPSAEAERKGVHFCDQNEKLPIAFGLISTSPSTPLRIVKSRQLCSDCHDATKLITKMLKREIIVREQNRIHHFHGGLCSCEDNRGFSFVGFQTIS